MVAKKKKGKKDGKIMDSSSVAAYRNSSYRMQFACQRAGFFETRLNRRL